MARRGRVGSYQLSVFGFYIVAVFGRIRIVHLAHCLVRFEFESNVRYSASNNNNKWSKNFDNMTYRSWNTGTM